MYILTSQLVQLKRPALPLPWYHRAPLGLMSGTPVHVALQQPEKRPFGDLLVSVVDPVNWQYVTEVSASTSDRPGVLADAYRHTPPLNIVFAEAVTVDSGSRHHARLVLEPFQINHNTDGIDADDIGPDDDIGDSVEAMLESNLSRLKASLEEKGFDDPEPKRLHTDQSKLVWMDVGRIDVGWVEVDGWREAIERQAEQSSEEAAKYDLNMAVISADTNRRILRYVFPRKGAVSISIKHADNPGVMRDIAGVLAKTKLNVLSSLLRRGSAPHSKAEVIVVVEPTDDCTDPWKTEKRARDALEVLKPELRVRVKVFKAVDPENSVLYPRRPHEIAVRPAKPLEATIRAVRQMYPSDRRLIFISRRFVDDPDERYNLAVVEELRRVIEEHGFVPVEALPQPGAEGGASDDVKAKMWASDAAIMFVVSTPDEEHAFSQNLAHECGFMQGQGKPLLPLVQKDLLPTITQNANLQGLQLMTFSRSHATSNQYQDSIGSRVGSWLKLLRSVHGWTEGLEGEGDTVDGLGLDPEAAPAAVGTE